MCSVVVPGGLGKLHIAFTPKVATSWIIPSGDSWRRFHNRCFIIDRQHGADDCGNIILPITVQETHARFSIGTRHQHPHSQPPQSESELSDESESDPLPFLLFFSFLCFFSFSFFPSLSFSFFPSLCLSFLSFLSSLSLSFLSSFFGLPSLFQSSQQLLPRSLIKQNQNKNLLIPNHPLQLIPRKRPSKNPGRGRSQ